MNNYKLGSLFDGSGGFPLAGTLCGIEPVWAAEVEPYPIAVTRSRFPRMKHLGDISKVNGAEIEPVDIITFGSPCQDLSVAGKRAGLKHEANGDEETTRSGLFMEAVRIIKEMRNATNGKYPTFALWENVPGAFSSNKGEDFRVVCEELIKIVEPTATMPSVPQKGWNYADSFIGDGWSLAYRVLDAQYWGVPQRRRRIYLVADFRAQRAREVLFEREGLRGYFTQGRTPWQGTPSDVEGSTGADDREGAGFDRYNQCLTGDVCATLRAPDGGDNCACVIERGRQLDAVTYSFDSLASNSMKSKNPHSGCREVEVAKTLDTTDPNPSKNQGGIAIVQPIPYTMKIRSGCEGGGKGPLVQEDKSATLATNNDQYLFQPVTDSHILDDQGGSVINVRTDGKSPTLRAQMGGHPPVVMMPGEVYSVENHPADSRVNLDESGKVQTLTSRMGTGGGNVPRVMGPKLFEFHGQDVRLKGPLDVAPTAQAGYGEGGSTKPLVVQPVVYDGSGVTSPVNASNPQPGDPCHTLGTDSRNYLVESVICLQGNGIDRADTAGCNGKGWKEDTSYTLNTIDRPAVSYLASGKETVGTLMANAGTKLWLGDREAFSGDYSIIEEHPPRYIVRRLTPTECARLQGFADWWGVVEQKDTLTEEEYLFWLEVRNTHARINGKKEQDYTAKQMLTWYNKLWTDSAEYKMWGNGIALPTALYVVQGIADVLNRMEPEIEDWML